MGAKETHPLSSALGALARVLGLALACYFAYDIRLYAVREYGRIIHEFDPWFNFRATQYLVDHGWRKFFTWYDHESWYPLGRPVGTTIYPGMQFTAAGIFRALNALGFEVSLNDVCVFMKGTRKMPQCGFSRFVVVLLNAYGVKTYKDVNVLADETLRSTIKEYSNWPTLPQVYIKGQFIGGCDIMKEMHADGSLEELLIREGIIGGEIAKK